ncbi:MAG TPA: ABC transporter permease [Thermomicrobiales bacterium]|nr:ABC transporter permease [Thermomicrobiales bacterium]
MTRPASRRWLLFAGAAAVPALTVVAPIFAFLVISLFRVENNQIIPQIGLGNYVEFFGSTTYRTTYLGSLLLCAEVALFTLVIGYPVAWFVWRRSGRLRNLLLLLTVLPLFMSYIVKLYTLRAALGLNGLLNQSLVGLGLLDKPSMAFLYNQRSVLLTMTVIYLPFVILPVFVSLERIPARLLEASSDLGASQRRTFRHIVVPLSLPGTVAGILFVFILALGDFITPQMVGGTSGFTFGRLIWSQFGLAFNWPLGAAMAAILLATALAVIVAATSLARRGVV